MGNFGTTIKSLREKKGLSREELAEMVGVSISSIQMYENGERVPRDGVKIKIAEVFNTSVESIFFND